MSNDLFSNKKLKGLLVSKVKVGKKRIEKNRDFSVISACASVKPCSLIVYKTNGHTRPPTFINREFAASLFKTHRFRENLAFSICSLFGRVYAISVCHSLGKIKTQKNPAIKDWIAENKKNGRGCFNCSGNVSQAQNGCKLMNYGHCFVNLQKCLCFCLEKNFLLK